MKKINKYIIFVIIALLNRIIVLPITLLSMSINGLATCYMYVVIFVVALFDYVAIRYIIRSDGIKDTFACVFVILITNFIFEIVSLMCINSDVGFQITFDTFLISVAQVFVTLTFITSKIIHKLNKSR